MKILHIVDYAGPHGGLYQILRVLARELADTPIEQDYLALEKTPYKLDPALVTLPMRTLSGQTYETALTEAAPDIVHIHTDLSNERLRFTRDHFYTIRTVHDLGAFCPRTGFDTAYCPVDPLFTEPRDERFIDQICTPCSEIGTDGRARYFERIDLLRSLPAIQCLSDGVMDYLLEMGIKRDVITKVPPLLAAPPASPAPTSHTIMFAGRMVEHKGVRELLEALAILPPNTDWRLRLAGTGERAYVRSLMRLAAVRGIKAKVEFLGHVPYEEYLDLYRDARLMVMPSIYAEGFGYTAYEALLYGVPIISFQEILGVNEWLRHGYNGLMVSFGDVPALASAINSVLTNDELHTKLRRNSVRWARRIRAADEVSVMRRAYEKAYQGSRELMSLGNGPDTTMR